MLVADGVAVGTIVPASSQKMCSPSSAPMRREEEEESIDSDMAGISTVDNVSGAASRPDHKADLQGHYHQHGGFPSDPGTETEEAGHLLVTSQLPLDLLRPLSGSSSPLSSLLRADPLQSDDGAAADDEDARPKHRKDRRLESYSGKRRKSDTMVRYQMAPLADGSASASSRASIASAPTLHHPSATAFAVTKGPWTKEVRLALLSRLTRCLGGPAADSAGRSIRPQAVDPDCRRAGGASR